MMQYRAFHQPVHCLLLYMQDGGDKKAASD